MIEARINVRINIFILESILFVLDHTMFGRGCLRVKTNHLIIRALPQNMKILGNIRAYISWYTKRKSTFRNMKLSKNSRTSSSLEFYFLITIRFDPRRLFVINEYFMSITLPSMIIHALLFLFCGIQLYLL